MGGVGSSLGRSAALRWAAAAIGIVCLLALLRPPAATAATVPSGFFGVSPAAIVSIKELEMMSDAGIESMRFPIFWPIIQPKARGSKPISQALDFKRFDPLFIEAARQGIRLMPYVYGTPRFLTRSPTVPPIGDPSLRREWTLLLQALEARYGPGGEVWKRNREVRARPVTEWQIWNEPNSPSYWSPVKRSPEGYAELLRISDAALSGGRGGTPEIVSAGLFTTPQNGVTIVKFLNRMYDVNGVNRWFDVLAIHPYAPSLGGVKLQVEAARSLMGDGGDSRKPLWITEVGWATGGQTQSPYYKTKGEQAELLGKLFKYTLDVRRRFKVQRVYWFTWRDNNVNRRCDLCRYSGLFEANLDPKPAWGVFVLFSGGST
jgi:hypothetical protein